MGRGFTKRKQILTIRNSDYYFIVEPEAEVELLGDFARPGYGPG